jgi:hypothetical protein
VHAHKHGFSRLIWLKDLDLLLRARAHCLDWRLAVSVARREGVTASLWYSLYLSSLILGTAVPPAALQALRPRRWLQALYRLAWPPEPIAALRGRMRRRGVQFRGADSWRGMLPGLLFMGRRPARTSVGLQILSRRLNTGILQRAPLQLAAPRSGSEHALVTGALSDHQYRQEWC